MTITFAFKYLTTASILFFASVVSAFEYGKSNCPFESTTVLSRQLVMSGKYTNVLVNNLPSNHGHIMIIPKRCIERFTELEPSEITEIGEMIKRIAQAFKDIYSIHDYIILQKNGENAGQHVQHLHFHIIPVGVNEKEVVIKKTFNFIERKELSLEDLEMAANVYREYFIK